MIDTQGILPPCVTIIDKMMIKAITKTRLRKKRDFFPFFHVYAEKSCSLGKNRVFCIKSVFGMKTIIFSVFW